MVLNQSILISIGFTCVTIILVFLYFKRKMSSLEFKLNSLYTLIEEHTNEKKQMQETNVTSSYQNNPEESKVINLIPVSDNELSSSDEEFTTEEEEEEYEPEDEQQENNTNTVNIDNVVNNLNLDIDDKLGIEEINVSDLDNQNSKLLILKNTIDQLESQVIDDLGDMSEITEPSDIEEETKKVILEKTINELENINLSKLTVPKLKELVKNHKLHETPSKLKKTELVSLLEKHQ